jgi:hypothetical protein
MKLTMLLADAAQAVEGKLYILGGGWSITGPGPAAMAIAIKIEVPWTEANRPHLLELSLLDEDGQVVLVPTPMGNSPLVLGGEFEVGRPAGLKVGTPLDVVLALTLGPIQLTPDRRYVWRCSIDGQSPDEWQVSFTTRPAQTQATPP